jgi:choline-glycine betaine transporter
MAAGMNGGASGSLLDKLQALKAAVPAMAKPFLVPVWAFLAELIREIEANRARLREIEKRIDL